MERKAKDTKRMKLAKIHKDKGLSKISKIDLLSNKQPKLKL